MTDQPIELRYDVRPDDRQSVRRLVESTGVFSAVEVDVAVELVDERLAEGPKSGYEFVFADENGRTVGYTCYGPIALTAASFDLYWIAVDKAMHGRKIGRLLLERTEELVRQAGGRQLYIETSNRHHYAATPRLLPPLRLPPGGAARGLLRPRRRQSDLREATGGATVEATPVADCGGPPAEFGDRSRLLTIAPLRGRLATDSVAKINPAPITAKTPGNR